MQSPKLARPLQARIEGARDDVARLLILRDAFEPGAVEEPLGGQLRARSFDPSAPPRDGLYLGQGWVVRCDREGELRIDTLSDFADGAEVEVIPHAIQANPDQVRIRALRACREGRPFEDSLHFVRWCRRPPQAHPRAPHALSAPALAAH